MHTHSHCRFRALADVAGAPTGATDAEPTVPEELLELAAADPNAEALFSGWEKLRTSGAPGVDLAVHKALAVLVGWAGVAEPLARLGTAAATKAIKTCVRSPVYSTCLLCVCVCVRSCVHVCACACLYMCARANSLVNPSMSDALYDCIL